jgi:hypothetical protein
MWFYFQGKEGKAVKRVGHQTVLAASWQEMTLRPNQCLPLQQQLRIHQADSRKKSKGLVP